MTADQRTKLQQAMNLIAMIPVSREHDRGERLEAHSLVKSVLDDSNHNPFTEHWKEEQQ